MVAITAAAARLGTFIEQQAERTALELGFGFELKADAPNRYPELCAAFDYSQETGAPLPISSANSDTVIYPDPATNFALRFWHHVSHVRRGLSFELVDELELSLWHLGELEKAGFARASLEWRLLHADMTGQGYVQAFARRFPFDQRRFVLACVRAGFDRGLLVELRRGGSSDGDDDPAATLAIPPKASAA